MKKTLAHSFNNILTRIHAARLKSFLARIYLLRNCGGYSQYSEDAIIKRIFDFLHITSPRYLDIGANDPIAANNTYFFYKYCCGWGVLVEPNPLACRAIKKLRGKDICLNAAIAPNGGEYRDFYLLNYSTLSSLSKEDADRNIKENQGCKILEVFKVKTIDINTIIQQYFNYKIDYVSIDIEGNTADILKKFDFSKCRPAVFCLETESNISGLSKDRSVEDIMLAFDYIVFADTRVNTIFVDKRAFLAK